MERRSDGGAEVACWAHCRRSIFDVWQTIRSTVAKAALVSHLDAIFIGSDALRKEAVACVSKLGIAEVGVAALTQRVPTLAGERESTTHRPGMA